MSAGDGDGVETRRLRATDPWVQFVAGSLEAIFGPISPNRAGSLESLLTTGSRPAPSGMAVGRERELLARWREAARDYKPPQQRGVVKSAALWVLRLVAPAGSKRDQAAYRVIKFTSRQRSAEGAESGEDVAASDHRRMLSALPADCPGVLVQQKRPTASAGLTDALGEGGFLALIEDSRTPVSGPRSGIHLPGGAATTIPRPVVLVHKRSDLDALNSSQLPFLIYDPPLGPSSSLVDVELARRCDVSLAGCRDAEEALLVVSGTVLPRPLGGELKGPQPQPRPIADDASGRPLVVYEGAVDEHLDYRLVGWLLGRNPGVDFMLVDRSGGDARFLPDFANLYVTASTKNDALPAPGRSGMCCFVPAKHPSADDLEWMERVCARGFPIVTSCRALSEAQNWLTASSFDEWERSIANALRRGAVQPRPVVSNKESVSKIARMAAHGEMTRMPEEASPEKTADASLIMVTHNNLRLTRLALQSVLLTSGEAEVIVVDNASSDGTTDFLRQASDLFSNLRVVFRELNDSFAAACNAGFALAAREYVGILNNDIVVTSGWLGGLIDHFHSDPGLAAVGPATNRAGNEAMIPVDYLTMTEMQTLARARRQEFRGRRMTVAMLGFFCVLLRRKAVQEVGGLDEGYTIGFFEDDDYCHRLTNAGYGLAVAEDVFVHHFGGATFGLIPPASLVDVFAGNRDRFERRWGIKWRPHWK